MIITECFSNWNNSFYKKCSNFTGKPVQCRQVLRETNVSDFWFVINHCFVKIPQTLRLIFCKSEQKGL